MRSTGAAVVPRSQRAMRSGSDLTGDLERDAGILRTNARKSNCYSRPDGNQVSPLAIQLGTERACVEVLSSAVVEGRAYRRVLQRSAEEQADLIVMGVHGRSAIDLLVFGSTTHHVIRAATCPVLIVRG